MLKHFLCRSIPVPRNAWVGSEKASSQWIKEWFEYRYGTLAYIDEAFSDSKGSQAAAIKVKQIITTNGVLNGIHKSKKISTKNCLTFIATGNHAVVRGFEPACAERFIVSILRYTTRDDCDEANFNKIPIDYELECILNTEPAFVLFAHLLAHWAAVSIFKKESLEFKKAPPSVQECTIKFKECAGGNVSDDDFWRKSDDEQCREVQDPSISFATWLSESLPNNTGIWLDQAVKLESVYRQATKIEMIMHKLSTQRSNPTQNRTMSGKLDAALTAIKQKAQTDSSIHVPFTTTKPGGRKKIKTRKSSLVKYLLSTQNLLFQRKIYCVNTKSLASRSNDC